MVGYRISSIHQIHTPRDNVWSGTHALSCQTTERLEEHDVGSSHRLMPPAAIMHSGRRRQVRAPVTDTPVRFSIQVLTAVALLDKLSILDLTRSVQHTIKVRWRAPVQACMNIVHTMASAYILMAASPTRDPSKCRASQLGRTHSEALPSIELLRYQISLSTLLLIG